MAHRVLQPEAWRPPQGYSNGVLAQGRCVFVAGQIGWDEDGRVCSSRMADQVSRALSNVLAVLSEANASAEHIVRMTWYITSCDEYQAQLREIGIAYRAVMGKHFPAMSVVQVAALLSSEAKVEIEATAVIPDPR